jgi:hypothetical protein
MQQSEGNCGAAPPSARSSDAAAPGRAAFPTVVAADAGPANTVSMA